MSDKKFGRIKSQDASDYMKITDEKEQNELTHFYDCGDGPSTRSPLVQGLGQ